MKRFREQFNTGTKNGRSQKMFRLLLLQQIGELPFNDDPILKLLSKGVDLDAKDWTDRTLLSVAVYYSKRPTIAAALLRAGAKPEDRLLYPATQPGYEEVLKGLLENGADPNCRLGHEGSTPLTSAAHGGSARSAQMLLDYGAEVDLGEHEDGLRPLQMAAICGNIDVAKVLMKAGADLSHVWLSSDAEETAKRQGHKEFAALLAQRRYRAEEDRRQGTGMLADALEYGNADSIIDEKKICGRIKKGFDQTYKDRQGNNMLHLAVRHGLINAVRELLDSGMDINKPDHSNYSPALLAIYFKHYALADFLLERQAVVLPADDAIAVNILRHTAVDTAIRDWLGDITEETAQGHDHKKLPTLRAYQRRKEIEAAGKRTADIMRELEVGKADSNVSNEEICTWIRKGVDLTRKDRDDNNMLHLAVSRGRTEVVRELLDAGMDIEKPDGSKSNPLYLAVCNGHEDIANMLLDRGAAVDKDEPRILSFACYKGSPAFIERLLSYGFDINKSHWAYHTPLVSAAEHDNAAVVQLLLERHADLELRPVGGSAEQRARECGAQAALAVLVKAREKAEYCDAHMMLRKPIDLPPTPKLKKRTP